MTGLVDATALAFTGGRPGPLAQVLGIWVEESDALPESSRRQVIASTGHAWGLEGVYEARHCCDLLHAKEAEVVAVYGDDFYAGSPAVTRNVHGKGQAFYIASRNDGRFQQDFFSHLAVNLGIPRALDAALPSGVTAHSRVMDGRHYLFVLNFKGTALQFDLKDHSWVDVETGETRSGKVQLDGFGSKVYERRANPHSQA